MPAVSGTRKLLRDVVSKLGQDRQEQYGSQDQADAVNEQESAGPHASRHACQRGELIGVGVGRPSAPSLADELDHRFRCREQQRPRQHIRQAGLHRRREVPAHQDQHDSTANDQYESVDSKITNSQSKPRLCPAIKSPTAPNPTTAGPR
jgi:hypothetical protein